MRSLRALVSGNRTRFKDGSYDLDLSYITPNIISMGFPSTGMESAYVANAQCRTRMVEHEYILYSRSGRVEQRRSAWGGSSGWVEGGLRSAIGAPQGAFL